MTDHSDKSDIFTNVVFFVATITMANWQEWFLMGQVLGTLQSQSSSYKIVQRSFPIFKKWLQSWNENGRD
jgi:hypothetical protein